MQELLSLMELQTISCLVTANVIEI